MPRFLNHDPFKRKPNPTASDPRYSKQASPQKSNPLSALLTRRNLFRATLATAGAVAFVTTYALILPAITLDQETADNSPGVDRELSESVSESLTSSRPDSDEGETGGETESESSDDAVWAEAASDALDSLDEDSTPADRAAAVAQSQEGYQADGDSSSLYADAAEGDSTESGGSFAAWCLDQAGVGDDFPVVAQDAAQWAETLQEQDAADEDVTLWKDEAPSVGDVAFVSSQADGQADQTGIVTDVKTGLLGNTKAVEVMQENEDGQIESVTYKTGDDRLCGYGVLPEEVAQTEDGTETLEAGTAAPETTDDSQSPETAASGETDAGEETAPAAETDTGEETGSADSGEAVGSDGADPVETGEAVGSDGADPVETGEAVGSDGAEPAEEPAETDVPFSDGQAASPAPVSALAAIRDTLDQLAGGTPAAEEPPALPETVPQMDTALETFQTLVDQVTVYDHKLIASTGDGITVTAEYNDGAFQVPVTLSVSTVETAPIADAVNEAAGLDNARTEMKAVDITFLDEDGGEVQPDAFVYITFQAEFLRTAAEPEVVHVDDRGNATLLEDAAASLDEVSVHTDSFSVYAIVYTVDFHYGDLTYSIQGGSSISLDLLFSILGVEENVADVADVSFSDPTLVKVVHKTPVLGVFGEESWILESLAPFDTTETLTITFRDGHILVIQVTDAKDPLGLDGRTFSLVTRGDNNGNRHALTFNGTSINHTNTTVKTADNSTVTNIETTDLLYSNQTDTAWTIHYDSTSGGYYIENNGTYLSFDGSIHTTNEANKTPIFLTKHQTVTQTGAPTNNSAGEPVGQYTYSYTNWDGTYLFTDKKLENYDPETNLRTVDATAKFLLDEGNGYSLAANQGDAQGARVKLCLPENPNSSSNKASMISATSLQDGQRIVIYQRVLQDDDRYRTYAIDGNGGLVEVFENSDSVYWVENDPSITWVLTEVKNADGSSSGYYTLQNEKTGLYLTPKDAPGEAGSQTVHTLSDFGDDAKHLNISLPGAAGGQYTSTIACWDYDANVTYGLAVTGGTDRDGATAPAALAVPELLDSQSFFFAACDPIVLGQLTTVDTVDSLNMGIKISMYDFTDTVTNDMRLPFMNTIMGNQGWIQAQYNPNMLSRTLDENGYPRIVQGSRAAGSGDSRHFETWQISSNQHSLSELFDETNSHVTETKNVNHLFLQSVYDESGFFKYSCFENFAQLNKTQNNDGSTDFTVYEQVGVPWTTYADGGSQGNAGNWEGRHEYYERGNFMPFDELTTSNGARTVNRDEDLNILPDTDARKGEPLYYIKNVNNGDYFFGMIMEGVFTQNPGGLSDRGDPMVFEFNGDDDMWVYLDGVLALDIGGVHDAFRGSINFRTGQIEVIGPRKEGNGTSTQVHNVTTIKEQFRQARVFPDKTPWDDSKVDQYFTGNTFKDYSTHTFKMFYMERGAGASNLDLMFNLTTMPESGFRVKKEMPSTRSDGVVQTQYADAPFYYQAYIRDKDKNGQNTNNETINGGFELYIPSEDTTEAPYTASEPYYETVVQLDNGTLETQKSDLKWLNDDPSTGIFVLYPGQTAFFPVREKGVEWYVKEVPPAESPVILANMLENFDVTNTDPSNFDPPYSTAEVKQLGTVTDDKSVTQRGVAVFSNYPDDSLVNELKIKKKLKGSMFRDPRTSSGFVEATQTNSPYFEYKVFLESTEGKLVPYSLGPYYQTDAEGNYVYYEKGVRKHPKVGSFEIATTQTPPMNQATTTFAYKYVYQTRDSSKAMGWVNPVYNRNGEIKGYEGYRVADGAGYIEYTFNPRITEHTSVNGSLGDIRDGDTITIKGLMSGTTFVVDERVDRSHMIQGTTGEDTTNKYLFEGTEVTGAYTGSTDDENLQARIDAFGSLYTNNPADGEGVSYSGKAGKGVIIPEEDALVLVKNKGEAPFSVTVQKKWSEAYDLDKLDDNAKVIFTLKRYKVTNKGGEFTLYATVTNQPDNYDPVYLIKNHNTGEVVRTITFSSMEPDSKNGTTETRKKTVKLPLGEVGAAYYVVELENNVPYGYNLTDYSVTYGAEGDDALIEVTSHVPSVGDPTPPPEADVTPDTATVSSAYTRQTGTLTITKHMTEGDVNLWSDFQATYIITGNGLETPITIDTSPVAGDDDNDPWTDSLSKWSQSVRLSPGRYTVTEVINADGPGVPEHKPSKRVVTVKKDDESVTALFEGSYKSRTIPVTIICAGANNNPNTYKSINGVEPGTEFTVNFNMPPIYDWMPGDGYTVTTTPNNCLVGNSHINGNNNPQSIRFTAPSSGELIINVSANSVEFWGTQYFSYATVNDSNFDVVTNRNSAPRRMMALRALTADGPGETREETTTPKTTNVGTAEKPIVNKVTPPAYNPDTQYVTSDGSWSLEVTLSKKATVNDAERNHVVSINSDGSPVYLENPFTESTTDMTWSAELDAETLEDLSFTLDATDEEGNLYYYYIDSVREENVPVGTTVTFDKDGKNPLFVSQNNSKVPLSVTNDISNDITLFKVDADDATKHLSGAVFNLNLLIPKDPPEEPQEPQSGGDPGSGQEPGSGGEPEPTDEYRILTDVTVFNASDGSVVTVSSDGSFTIPAEGVRLSGLASGSYALREKTPPVGYIVARDPAMVFVLSDGTIVSVNDAEPDSDGKALILKIPNTTGAELPHAGGPGASLFLLSGAAVLTAGAVLFGVWRRRDA